MTQVYSEIHIVRHNFIGHLPIFYQKLFRYSTAFRLA